MIVGYLIIAAALAALVVGAAVVGRILADEQQRYANFCAVIGKRGNSSGETVDEAVRDLREQAE